MNFYEQQLRRFTGSDTALKSKHWVYVGRAAFLPLSEQRRARLEFVTCGTSDQYEALKVTVLNPKDGRIDSLTLPFADYFKPQAGGCNGAAVPHIWICNGKASWYKTPTISEIQTLVQAAHNYIMLFA